MEITHRFVDIDFVSPVTLLNIGTSQLSSCSGDWVQMASLSFERQNSQFAGSEECLRSWVGGRQCPILRWSMGYPRPLRRPQAHVHNRPKRQDEQGHWRADTIVNIPNRLSPFPSYFPVPGQQGLHRYLLLGALTHATIQERRSEVGTSPLRIQQYLRRS